MTLTTFFRLLKTPVDAKGARLAAQIAALNATGQAEETYTLDPADFFLIPGSPFAYWVAESIRQLFRTLPSLAESGVSVQHGASSKNDFRFLRLAWEAPLNTIGQGLRWALFAKGGEYSPFYADVHLLVNWENDAQEIHEYLVERYPYLDGNTDWILHPENTYFHPGITYISRPMRGFCARVLPAACVFAHISPAIFVSDKYDLFAVLAILNSATTDAFLSLSLSRGSETSGQTKAFEVGQIQRMPFSAPAQDVSSLLHRLASEAHDLQRERDRTNETTHAFCLPGLARYRERSLHEAARALDAEEQATQARLNAIQSEIDDLVFDLYGLSVTDRELIRREMGESANRRTSESAKDTEHATRNAESADTVDEEEPSLPEDLPARVQNLLMWCVGVAFGRWDVRKALDPALLPPLGGPFDPLPRCAPGALTGTDGLPPVKAADIASEAWLRARENVLHIPPFSAPPHAHTPYPLPIAWDGILVDDPTHPSDIVIRVRSVLALLWGDRADTIEREACEVLGLRALRDYFRDPRQGFFPFHIKRYSKSRRKAPIYWLLQSEKRSYAIWFYCHRLTPATLYAAGRDYADAKVALEMGRLEELRQGLERLAGSARKHREQEIERQQRLVAEVTDFRNRLDAVALRNLPPDLNDGVLISIAPLWELVPWKEAQHTWEALAAGEYAWSTMARQMRERGLVR